MTPRRVSAAEAVAAVAALADGTTRFVGVDGLGASGKTTLAAALIRTVPGAQVMHLDDLQPPGITEWDWDALGAVVRRLATGRPADYDLWSWGASQPHGTATVAPGGLVVVEGVSSTRREARVPWDLTIWMQAPQWLRRRRVAERDGEQLAETWRTAWIPTEQAYAERERPWERVHLVVDGTGRADDLGQSDTS